MENIQISLICSLLISCGTSESLPKIKVDSETGYFIDNLGQFRLFHGINSVIKKPPWYDEKLLDKNRQKELAELGINVVRLGVMWSGVQPTEGLINDTYLDVIENLVKDLAGHGIYSILDMHQDVLWQAGPEEDQGYWGVPKWVKDKLEKPEHLYPWPWGTVPKHWVCGYLTLEISQGFSNLYNNVNGVSNDFANFWKIVAKRFKSHSSVLGYELMNEPGLGDIFINASYIFPGIQGHKNLKPFYEKISRAIREEDDETIIFWEPLTYSYFLPFDFSKDTDESVVNFLDKFLNIEFLLQFIGRLCGPMYTGNATNADGSDNNKTVSDSEALLNFIQGPKVESEARIGLNEKRNFPSIVGPGFENPPGGDNYKNRTVLSWHYYCWLLDKGSEKPMDIFKGWICDKVMAPTVFEAVNVRRKQIGGGTFLTEFGLCQPNMSNPSSSNTVECDKVLQHAEQSFESWAYWDTASGGAFWDSKGALIYNLVIFFARPYPVKTAGKPKKLTFDVFNKTFEYQFYTGSNENKLATEIFLPKLHFPHGDYSVSTSENLSWKLSETNEDIIQVFQHEHTTNPQLSTVEVRPKRKN